MKITVQIGFLLLLLLVGAAQAASFDCKRAQTHNEKYICSNPVLSSLDEQYTALYKQKRANSIDDEALFIELKYRAVTALQWRETHCKNQFCLLEWYENRIEQLNFGDTGPNQPQLTLGNLFRKLNMRSLKTSLKAPSSENTQPDDFSSHCKTYPADFFPSASIIKISADTLWIEYENTAWYFKIAENNRIEVADKSPYMDYYIPMSANVEFKKPQGEWRADRQQPEWSTWCIPVEITWPTVNKTRTIFLDTRANAVDPRSDEVESSSVGEIQFSGIPANRDKTLQKNDKYPQASIPHYVTTTPVYAKAGGSEIGKLVMALKPDAIGETAAAVQIQLFGQTKAINPPVRYRRKIEPTLFLYERKGTWVNLSQKNQQAYWIDLSTVPALQAAFITRDEVIKHASAIKVRSAHNLRAAPSTDSKILAVLGKTGDEDMFPLEVQGDWVKVHYVQPSIAQLYDENVLNSLGPGYTQAHGWIKFRGSDGRENIKVRYYYD